MKASDVIDRLNTLIREHGDLDVVTLDAEYDALDIAEFVKYVDVQANRWQSALLPAKAFLIDRGE